MRLSAWESVKITKVKQPKTGAEFGAGAAAGRDGGTGAGDGGFASSFPWWPLWRRRAPLGCGSCWHLVAASFGSPCGWGRGRGGGLAFGLVRGRLAGGGLGINVYGSSLHRYGRGGIGMERVKAVWYGQGWWAWLGFRW